MREELQGAVQRGSQLQSQMKAKEEQAAALQTQLDNAKSVSQQAGTAKAQQATLQQRLQALQGELHSAQNKATDAVREREAERTKQAQAGQQQIGSVQVFQHQKAQNTV